MKLKLKNTTSTDEAQQYSTGIKVLTKNISTNTPQTQNNTLHQGVNPDTSIEKSKITVPDEEKITLHTYLASKYHSKNTIGKYYLYANKFHKVHDLTQNELTTYINNHDNTVCRNAMRNYIEWRNMYDGKEHNVKIIKKIGQKPTKPTKRISKDQVDKLISNLPYPLNLMIKVMFETGMRRFELINLKEKDFDTSHCTLKGVGKRNKYFTVRISKSTRDKLKNFIKLKHKDDESPYIFSEYHNLVMHPERKFYYQFTKECKKLGLNITPHSIRHSLGFHLRGDLGWDLIQVKHKLRHASVTTTQIYTTSTDKEIKKLEDKTLFNNE